MIWKQSNESETYDKHAEHHSVTHLRLSELLTGKGHKIGILNSSAPLSLSQPARDYGQKYIKGSVLG